MSEMVLDLSEDASPQRIEALRCDLPRCVNRRHDVADDRLRIRHA